jgi:hypothetical protein
MSGPITAGYVCVHGTLMLIARALQEARAMKREYAEVLAELEARERALAAARAGQCAARLERIAAVRNEAARQHARLGRLRALAQSAAEEAPDIAVPVPPAIATSPAGDDDAAWAEHLAALDGAVREMERVLARMGGTSGERVRQSLAAAGSAPSIDDVLAAYVLERQLRPGLDSAQSERFRQTAARVLARLDVAPGAPLPSELETLARAIVLAPSVERAEALASELRRAVQQQRDAYAAQAADAVDAKRLLDSLPEATPEPLLRALEQVAAGAERMDAALRRSASDVLDSAAADRQQAEQEAAAYVLEQSLRDLGYEVEDIGATLFVGGGAVHFRRAGWENYFVRLRVDPDEHTVNFNVVRARGDEDTAERRRQDALAEDRWCAEFPRLMATLAARGLVLDVRRRLAAGEVPVQVVDGASLPRVHADDDAARPRAAPLARKHP